MKRTILLLHLLSLIICLPAQSLEWLNGGGNSVSFDQQDILLLPTGEALTVGKASSGTHSFTPLTVNVPIAPGNYSSFAYLAKTDANGEYQWVSILPDSSTREVRLSAFSSATVIVAAQVVGSTFDLGGGIVVSMPPGTTIGTIVAKYSISTGQISWATLIPNATRLGDIAVGNGLIYVTGSYADNFIVGQDTLPNAPPTPFSAIKNGYLAQLDSSGTILGATHMASLANPAVTNFAFVEPYALAITSNQVFVAGRHQEAMQVGSFFLSQSSGGGFDSTDLFLASYTHNLGVTWARSSVGASFQAAQSLAATPDGGILVGGVHTSDFDFAGTTIGSVGYVPPQYWGGFAMKLTSMGLVEWGIFTDGQIYSTASDGQGGYWVGGSIDGSLGAIQLAGTSQPVAAGDNAFVARLDSLGGLTWFQYGLSTGGGGFGWKGSSSLSADQQGRVAACGRFQGSLSWGSSTLTSGPNWDHFALVLADTVIGPPPPPPFPTDSVWPGDVNYDLTATLGDLISLGLVYGQSGPARPDSSLNWVGQPCYDWTDSIPGTGGVNAKHADTDGNGLVNVDDTLAILQNLGLMHLRTGDVKNTGPLLYPEFLNDSLQVGDTAQISINLGVDSLQAMDIYGLAFSLTFDTSLVDFSSLQISYDSSWLGVDLVDMLTLEVAESSGQLDMALTRIDQMDRDGFGALAHLSIIMVDDLTAKTELSELLRLSISNVLAISGTGEPLSIATSSDSVVLTQTIEDSSVTSLPSALAPQVWLYPQPATDQLEVGLSHETVEGWSLWDMAGRELAGEQVRFQTRTLQFPKLLSGWYILRLQTPSGLIQRRVWLLKP